MGEHMRVLVTAGNTQVPIDSVRCITNIFTGRTGARLALHGQHLGHEIVLLTSHPETVAELSPEAAARSPLHVERYRTFDDLAGLMERFIRKDPIDVIIHCAAVSDYLTAGTYAPAPGVQFDPTSKSWSPPAVMVDRGSTGKVKSDEPELWLRMVRAPKIIDRIRQDWDWKGVLVKFKLEVGKSDADLLEIAERSRLHSQANLMVANTLEGASEWAYLGPINGLYQKISRNDLPAHLYEQIARINERRMQHG